MHRGRKFILASLFSTGRFFTTDAREKATMEGWQRKRYVDHVSTEDLSSRGSGIIRRYKLTKHGRTNLKQSVAAENI